MVLATESPLSLCLEHQRRMRIGATGSHLGRDPDRLHEPDPTGKLAYFILLHWEDNTVASIRDFRFAR
jgi:hypothetical protein